MQKFTEIDRREVAKHRPQPTPYDGLLGPTPFGDAVDEAIARENAAAAADPQRRSALDDSMAMWRDHILPAREIVADKGVVLPTKVAEQIVAALTGKSSTLSPNLLSKMVQAEIDSQEARG